MNTQEHPCFIAFKKLAMICKMSPQKDKILKFVLAGSGHNNLASYHGDKNISVAVKQQKYQEALNTFNPTGQENPPKYPFSESVAPQPSDVFGYAEEAAGQIKNPSLSKMMKELQIKLQVTSDELKDTKKASGEQEHLIKKLLEEKEELEKQQPKIIEVKIDGQLKGRLEGEKFHKQLPLIVKLLSARNAMGFSEFIYIWGAPGSGKTHMAKQIGKCLGVKTYTYPIGPTITEGKLLGFNNIATGSFVAGWLYEAYKNGGLVALDEIDLADAAVLGATNSIENDAYIFGNGEFAERHKDFYLIAFANTLGTGSTKGFTRNILDAATRDRFTTLELEYDEQLEQDIYGNQHWATYVQRVRKYVKDSCNSSFYVTPRATRKGAAYLKAGIPHQLVVELTIFKGCPRDLKNSIIQNVGEYPG